jgi:hypothetical protein
VAVVVDAVAVAVAIRRCVGGLQRRWARRREHDDDSDDDGGKIEVME